MSNEAIPKLRVVDGGGAATKTTEPPAATAPATGLQAPAPSPSLSWPMILLFLIGAAGGGVCVPLLGALLP